MRMTCMTIERPAIRNWTLQTRFDCFVMLLKRLKVACVFRLTMAVESSTQIDPKIHFTYHVRQCCMTQIRGTIT